MQHQKVHQYQVVWNIKTVQHLIGQYYNSTILNNATIAIAISTSTTVTSATSKCRTSN